MLWELLSGQRPFDHEAIEGQGTLEAIIAARRRGLSPKALAALPADLPEGLRDALLKCLEPDPDERFATAAELAHELRLALDPLGVRLSPRAHAGVAAVGLPARRNRDGAGRHPAESGRQRGQCLLRLVQHRGPAAARRAHYVFLGTLVTLFKAVLYILGMIVWAVVRPAGRPPAAPVSPLPPLARGEYRGSRRERGWG